MENSYQHGISISEDPINEKTKKNYLLYIFGFLFVGFYIFALIYMQPQYPTRYDDQCGFGSMGKNNTCICDKWYAIVDDKCTHRVKSFIIGALLQLIPLTGLGFLYIGSKVWFLCQCFLGIFSLLFYWLIINNKCRRSYIGFLSEFFEYFILFEFGYWFYSIAKFVCNIYVDDDGYLMKA